MSRGGDDDTSRAAPAGWFMSITTTSLPLDEVGGWYPRAAAGPRVLLVAAVVGAPADAGAPTGRGAGTTRVNGAGVGLGGALGRTEACSA